MKNRKRKSGVSSTKGSIHTVRDKDVSNRSTGNKGHSRKNSTSISKHNKNIESNNRILNKLNPTGKANYLKITDHGNHYLIPLKPIREHSANCKEFLQFIERYLSTGKSDAQHKSYFIKKLLITSSMFYKFKWYGSS